MKYIDGGTIYEVEKINYWETLRTQAAIAAMQGLIGIRKNDTFETIAKIAVQQADALMEELKKTGGYDNHR